MCSMFSKILPIMFVTLLFEDFIIIFILNYKLLSFNN
jgi:hypothetical protein